MNKIRFKKLLDEGIHNVVGRQGESFEIVETEIGHATEFSRATVQHWRRGNPPPSIKTLEQIATYCLKNGRLDLEWAKAFLLHGGHSEPDRFLDGIFNKTGDYIERIFMCYARGVEPDHTVAIAVAQELIRENDVFFDQAINTKGWAEKIEEELESCDFIVYLISEESLTDEVVLSEMDIAYRLFQKKGKPRFLPVRLNYFVSLNISIEGYFSEVNWADWQNQSDTFDLIETIKQALIDGEFQKDEKYLQQETPSAIENSEIVPIPIPAVHPIKLETPEGTMDSKSYYYIERECDETVMDAISQIGETITIKGPRQMGKSSLLIRVMEAANKIGKEVVFIDIPLLRSSFDDTDDFFRQFCRVISMQLGVSDRTDQYWSVTLANAFRSSQYLLSEVLKKLDRPILLAMDEVDSLFDTYFSTNFFIMLRTWHNNRARGPYWKNLDLALVTSTEPYYFVSSLTQSPFNVGTIVELPNFSEEQVSDLNSRHKSPFDMKELEMLTILLNGHPYLVRKALYLVASTQITTGKLFNEASSDYGPFGDHLRSLLLRLHQNKKLLRELRLAIQKGKCSDEAFFRLRGTGLVERKNGLIVPRCQLYADFFEKHLSNDY